MKELSAQVKTDNDEILDIENTVSESVEKKQERFKAYVNALKTKED